MSDAAMDRMVDFEVELDAPPGRVWRAVSVPGLRERWLPGAALAGAEALDVTPGREISYRMRDDAPPFLESTVTFHLAPGAAGGTCLRVVQRLTDPRLARPAANGNAPLMRAA